MARIRTLKPELLEDEKTAGLSHEGFRLFVGVILLADDHGLVRADSSWLNGQIFWNTPATSGIAGVDECLEELAAAKLIQLYEVRGQRYMSILGWAKHQRVDHPAKPRVPPPSEDGAWLLKPKTPDIIYFIQAQESKAIKIGISWNPLKRLLDIQNGHHEILTVIGQFPGTIADERSLHAEFSHLRLSGEWFRCDDSLLRRIAELAPTWQSAANPREGCRGFSREESTVLATDLRPPTSDPDPERDRQLRGSPPLVDISPRKVKSRSAVQPEEAARARAVLSKLSERSGVAYRGSNKHLSLIAARLRDGFTELDLRAVVAYCASERGWQDDPKMKQYLRPETLFGPENIEKYVDAARTWAEREYPHEFKSSHPEPLGGEAA